MRKFVNDFEGASYNGITKVVEVDCINCQSITLVNTSLAGSIFINDGNIDLQPGQSFQIVGKDLQNNKGKLTFTLTNFFANIDYAYCLIKKRFTDAELQS